MVQTRLMVEQTILLLANCDEIYPESSDVDWQAQHEARERVWSCHLRSTRPYLALLLFYLTHSRVGDFYGGMTKRECDSITSWRLPIRELSLAGSRPDRSSPSTPTPTPRAFLAQI